GVDEGGVADGHGHGQPGADRGPPPGGQHDLFGGGPVGPGAPGGGAAGAGACGGNGKGRGRRFPERPGAQLIPGGPAPAPPGRITAMSFYPCEPAAGKLIVNGEVRKLATEQAGDELFGLPPEEFVAARDDLARRLKREGDAKAAARIKALRRPPLSAWAVNRLARQHGAPPDPPLVSGRRAPPTPPL